MSKKIKFNPVNELAEQSVPPPAPAEEYIPEWFQKMAPFFTKRPEFNVDTGRPNTTVKMCMPFFDSFTMGYIQATWTDIWIEKNNEGTFFYFPAGPKIMSERNIQASSMMPSIDGYYHQHFTWHPAWMPEVPPGYSCLITTPFNQDELPFRIFTGVIDSDTFATSEEMSNIPFLLKENFAGLIKKGTPMYQIIPFKRESWVSEVNSYNIKKQISINQKVRQFMWSGYKKLHWKKKEFN